MGTQFVPPPPRSWAMLMQELEIADDRERVAINIFEEIGRLEGALVLADGRVASFKEECEMYLEGAFEGENLTWQAVAFWLLEENVPMPDLLREGISLVADDAATLKQVAAAIARKWTTSEAANTLAFG